MRRYPGHVRSRGSPACAHRLRGRGRAGVLRLGHPCHDRRPDRSSPRAAAGSERPGRRAIRGGRGRPRAGRRRGRARGPGRRGARAPDGAPHPARATGRRDPVRAHGRPGGTERRGGRGVHLLTGDRAGRTTRSRRCSARSRSSSSRTGSPTARRSPATARRRSSRSPPCTTDWRGRSRPRMRSLPPPKMFVRVRRPRSRSSRRP